MASDTTVSSLPSAVVHAQLWLRAKVTEPVQLPWISTSLHPLVLLTLVCSVLYLLTPPRTKKQRLVPNIPVVGVGVGGIGAARKRFLSESRDMLLEGYRKYGGNGGMFYVPSPLGERLMIPPKYVEELKSAPVDKVDFVATFIEMFEGKYTTMGSRSTLHPRTVKHQLNQNLINVMPAVEAEIRDAFAAQIPPCEDWTALNMADKFVQIVARVSSRMFGGTALSQHDEWVQSTINFATDGFIGAQKLKKTPVWLRPIASRFMPEIQKISHHYDVARKVLIPLLQERDKTGERPLDLLQWMKENAQGEETDYNYIAEIQLKVSFAAIHTSAAAPTQLIYDLCAMPEYIEPLRDEIIQALREENGKLTKQAFLKMPRLDSFMKESQRFNPLLLITFERLVTDDLTLSDGFTIPANTQIGVPTHAVTMDSTLYPDPEKFDGFRFHRLKSHDPIAASRQVYAASNLASMSFGYGRHACPGRFFASNEIKAIMVYLLLNYDFKFPEGQQRPPSLVVETQYLPNHAATVLMRKRTPEF
ncbi:putative cytochrome P450 [Sphaerosporella brunnea]|uniref:Putative cytochrome P450 n=1 Tax=Sphaerosporella brunnea TaxID=1250544 RepID=A0A5J5F231_9PEZI|nr:putative cytochrome P450 [Sphaerosporella brunnea]